MFSPLVTPLPAIFAPLVTSLHAGLRGGRRGRGSLLGFSLGHR
jgi:hypothetical protein